MESSRCVLRLFRPTNLRSSASRPFFAISRVPPHITRTPPVLISRTSSSYGAHSRSPRAVRPFSTSTAPRQEASASPASPAQTERADVPSYEMRFTCKKCMTPQAHKISKQAYHSGTVLVTCPGCKNRHLVADHLKIFSDKSITLEDILKQKGEVLKKGTLSADGDLEFWDDGTTTVRQATTTADAPPARDAESAKS